MTSPPRSRGSPGRLRRRPIACSFTRISPSRMRPRCCPICKSSASATSTPRRSSRRGRARRTATTRSTPPKSTLSSAGSTASSVFAAAVKAHGMYILLDIVPNHMGVGGGRQSMVALAARMGRVVAACRHLRCRLGTVWGPTASSSRRSSAASTARRWRRATWS